MSAFIPRSHIKGDTHDYISPIPEIYAGIWTLFAGATVFLGLRLWCKVSRKHATGMWYDDYILIASWVCILVRWNFLRAFLLSFFTAYPLHERPSHYRSI